MFGVHLLLPYRFSYVLQNTMSFSSPLLTSSIVTIGLRSREHETSIADPQVLKWYEVWAQNTLAPNFSTGQLSVKTL